MNKAEADMVTNMIARFEGMLKAEREEFSTMLEAQRGALCEVLAEIKNLSGAVSALTARVEAMETRYHPVTQQSTQ